MPYNLLVLGPGQRLGDPPESTTRRLGEIMTQMAEALSVGGFKPFRVVTAESTDEGGAIQFFMNEIEQADLVLLDLTGNQASVAYEAGIIHTLGIPHIFITRDKESPSSFSGAGIIRGFETKADFDRANASPAHRELLERLSKFLMSGDMRAAMSENILTSHFGLPVVDLAASAGIATSYYASTVRLFIGPNGFAGRPCKLLFNHERASRFSRGKIVTSTWSVTANVKALVAVEPPGQLSNSYAEDESLLNASLRDMGLRLEPAIIAGTDPLDKVEYRGCFDKKGIARGSAVCIEIPAIAYQLAESLQMLRLRQRRDLLQENQRQMMEEMEERALEKLLASFRRNLSYHIGLERDAKTTGFYYVPLSELKATLKKLGSI